MNCQQRSPDLSHARVARILTPKENSFLAKTNPPNSTHLCVRVVISPSYLFALGASASQRDLADCSCPVERDKKLDAMSQNRLDFSISNVENEIIKVENEIKEVEDKREKESDSEEKKFLRTKEGQLRKEKEQLRKEKEQLRTKEEQLRQESRLTLESSPKVYVALTPPHTLSLSLFL